MNNGLIAAISAIQIHVHENIAILNWGRKGNHYQRTAMASRETPLSALMMTLNVNWNGAVCPPTHLQHSVAAPLHSLVGAQ